MKKFGILDFYKLTFSAIIVAVMFMMGCGGGSGEGRQTLPGENPFGPIVIPGTGTGTITGTGTSTSTGTGTGTGTGTETEIRTPAEMLEKGWKVMEENYGGSISYFTNVLNDSSATPQQRQMALNSRGWAKVYYHDTIEGIDDFKDSYKMGELATGSFRESILGYAMVLLQKAGEENLPDVTRNSYFDRAISLLADELGLSNPAYILNIEHSWVGVTSPEAHAMLSFAYFWRNFYDEAKAQIEQARIDDPSSTGIVNQVYETLVNCKLFE